MNPTLEAIRDGVIAWARSHRLLVEGFPADFGLEGSAELAPFDREATTFFPASRQIVRVTADPERRRLLLYTRLKLAARKIGRLQEAFAWAYGKAGYTLEVEVSRPFRIDQRVELVREPVRWHWVAGQRRIACGSSIGIGNQRNAGTLTALARKLDEPEALYGIGCNHVLGGCSTGLPGMPVVVPGIQDVTSETESLMVIGRHVAVAPMVPGLPGVVATAENADLAFFLIEQPEWVSSMQGEGEEAYETPMEIREPELDLEVKKWGRSSGLTRGRITAIVEESMPIDYQVVSYFGPTRSQTFKGTIYYERVVEVEGYSSGGFSVAGDSGALVVTADALFTVGMVIAGDRRKSVVLPLGRVLRGMELVGSNG